MPIKPSHTLRGNSRSQIVKRKMAGPRGLPFSFGGADSPVCLPPPYSAAEIFEDVVPRPRSIQRRPRALFNRSLALESFDSNPRNPVAIPLLGGVAERRTRTLRRTVLLAIT